MLIKIYGGTRPHGTDHLCESCRSSRIVRGHRNDEEIVFCDAMAMHPVQIAFKVTSCTDYIDGREPTYHELLEKAWVLTPGSRRRAAGFVKGSELRETELHKFMHDPTGRDT